MEISKGTEKWIKHHNECPWTHYPASIMFSSPHLTFFLEYFKEDSRHHMTWVTFKKINNQSIFKFLIVSKCHFTFDLSQDSNKFHILQLIDISLKSLLIYEFTFFFSLCHLFVEELRYLSGGICHILRLMITFLWWCFHVPPLFSVNWQLDLKAWLDLTSVVLVRIYQRLHRILFIVLH